ncbi:unnamed protein product [Polarella glacialis]|uniref:Uncharacterized protein n=1 Tax=Polarella glacialis TaxID=89957 RepID=A0A813LPL1_POLGL|nr:unnamed protein product [Polarella glacialis]
MANSVNGGSPGHGILADRWDKASLTPLLGDRLAGHYGFIAADSGLGVDHRQAATFFVQAEGHLDAGDGDSALSSAQEAVKAARLANDADILADSMRLMVKARCLRWRGGAGRGSASGKSSSSMPPNGRHITNGISHINGSSSGVSSHSSHSKMFQANGTVKQTSNNNSNTYNSYGASCSSSSRSGIRSSQSTGRGAETQDELSRARRMAKDEAKAFKQSGQARGEALMFLSQAEVHLERRGFRSRQAGLQLASSALEALRALGERDRLAEATAQATVLRALIALRDSNGAQATADSTLALYRSLADKRGEAKALHSAALARGLGGTRQSYDEGIRFASDAAVLYQDLGMVSSQADAQLLVGQLNLDRGRADLALHAARSTMALLAGDRGKMASSFRLLVDAHLELCEFSLALQISQEAVASSEQLGSRRQQAGAKSVLARAMLATDNIEEALSELQAALALSRAEGDVDLEATLLLSLCRAHEQDCADEDALEAAEDAVALWESLNDHDEEVACAEYAAALVLLRLCDCTGSLKAASKARGIFSAAGDKYREALCLVLIASIIFSSGKDADGALDTVLVAKDLFRERGDARGEAYALQSLGEFHRAQGKLEEEFYRKELWRGSSRDGVPFKDREDFVARSYEGGFAASHPLNLLAQINTWRTADVSQATKEVATLAQTLKRITARVYLMPGSTDTYFSAADIEAESRLIPNCRFAPIESAWGHRAGDPHRPGQEPEAEFIAQHVAELLAEE